MCQNAVQYQIWRQFFERKHTWNVKGTKINVPVFFLCPDAIFDVRGVHVFSDKHKNSKIPTTLVLISREYWMETFCLISRKVYLEGKSKSSKKVQFLEWMLKDSLESLFSVNAESSSPRWRGMPGVTCQLALHITALHVTMSRRTTSSLTSNLDCT